MPYAPRTSAPQGATASGSSLARAPRARRTGARYSTWLGRSSSMLGAWRAYCPPRSKRPASSGDCTTRLSWRAPRASWNSPSWARHSSRPLPPGAGTAGCGCALRTWEERPRHATQSPVGGRGTGGTRLGQSGGTPPRLASRRRVLRAGRADRVQAQRARALLNARLLAVPLVPTPPPAHLTPRPARLRP
jgi:hypothetical protein